VLLHACIACFVLMKAIQLFVVLFVYPETKVHTMEQLQRRLVSAE
jgi:hypothetical protein